MAQPEIHNLSTCNWLVIVHYAKSICNFSNVVVQNVETNQEVKLKKKTSNCRLLLHRSHLKVHQEGVHGTKCPIIFNHLQDLIAKCSPEEITNEMVYG